MTATVWAVGLMTGTVLDGNIDIAAIRTNGERIAEFGPWTLASYPDEVRRLLPEALVAAAQWDFAGPEPAIFAQAEAALTLAQAEAVATFLRETGLRPRVVGFHGQTVLHRAPHPGRPGATRQLGDGQAMAARLGIDVVYDFRSADVAAGGQGAPLAATYHAALLRGIGAGADTAVLNLGGVGNVSWCAGGDDDTADSPGPAESPALHAFDTGPANAPCNDWVRRHGAGEMDRDGQLAGRGRVDEARLAALLQHPYFAAPYPKSLDRNSFTVAMAEGLSLADGAATLTAFSAAAVGRALDLLPQRPRRLVVCGGGRHNPALMAALTSRTGCAAVAAEAVGWRGDAIEAECFAFLAVRSLNSLPISFPGTTGVSAPMVGGRLAPARG